jgi:hypothetical protein
MELYDRLDGIGAAYCPIGLPLSPEQGANAINCSHNRLIGDASSAQLDVQVALRIPQPETGNRGAGKRLAPRRISVPIDHDKTHMVEHTSCSRDHT